MRIIHVTLRVKPEKVGLYEHTFNELKDKVRQYEPGCALLEACKDPDDPHTYHVIEAYTDEHAVEEHVKTPYYKTTADIFVQCLQGDHMKEIEERNLQGREMYGVIKSIDFQRLYSI